jgi:septum site-determining protein MinC
VSASPKPDHPSRPMLRFRGRSFLALALAPAMPLDGWLADLDAWLERSPGFFSGRPVILDLSGAKILAADLATFIADLAGRGIRIMAVEGIEEGSLGLGLPPAIGRGRDATLPEAKLVAGETAAPARTAPEPMSLILDEPVRSGQTVFHPRGDVIVMGSVASGSEIVAGGSIHVYGALRGRAIAGVANQPGARIICRKFEAELLAIDGLYKAADDMDPALHARAISARIVDDALVVSPLD